MEETIARAAQITVAITVAFGVVLWFSLVVWTYRDIIRRTDSALVQIFSTVLVILGFVPGAIVYLLMRPRETMEERYQREVEAAFLESELSNVPACPECGETIRDEFQFCPGCGLELRRACPDCGRLVETDWQVCAFCGVDLGSSTSRAATSDLDEGQEEEPAEWEVELGPPVPTGDTGELPAAERDWEPVAQSAQRQSSRR